MGASWLDVENVHAHLDTMTDNNLFGYMLTTWHTISSDLPNVIPISKKSAQLFLYGKGRAHHQ